MRLNPIQPTGPRFGMAVHVPRRQDCSKPTADDWEKARKTIAAQEGGAVIVNNKGEPWRIVSNKGTRDLDTGNQLNACRAQLADPQASQRENLEATRNRHEATLRGRPVNDIVVKSF